MNTARNWTFVSLMTLALAACGGVNRPDPLPLQPPITTPNANSVETDFLEQNELLNPTLSSPTLSSQALESGGLNAEFYPQLDFGGTASKSRGGEVNFDWGSDGPPLLAGIKDNFSVRWSGKIEAKYSEVYTFVTRSDDGVRLFVNGKRLINDWTDHASLERKASIRLTAGQKYDIKLEYFERGGQASVKLLWQSPSQPLQAIPSSSLFSESVAGLPNPANFRTNVVKAKSLTFRWDTVVGANAYQIERKVGSGPYVVLGVYESDLSIPAGVITPSTTYTYRLKAVAGSLQSSGVELTVTTPAVTPELPTPINFRIKNLTPISVGFDWDNVQGANAYLLERKNLDGTYSYVGSFESGGFLTVRDLIPNTSYTFRLKAVASIEESLGAEVTFTTPAVAGLPDPANFRTKNVTATSIGFEWDFVQGAYAYQLELKKADGTYEYQGSYESSGFVAVGNLTPDTTYTFRLKAIGGGLPSFGVETTVSTLRISGPPTSSPVNFSLRPLIGNRVELSWSKLFDASSYQIERAVGNTTTYTPVATTAETTYSNTGLQGNTLYTFRVRGVNSFGPGDWSYQTIGTVAPVN